MWYKHKILLINWNNKLTKKPWPDGLALAFQESKPSQSRHEAVIAAWLGPAYGDAICKPLGASKQTTEMRMEGLGNQNQRQGALLWL